MSHLHWHGGAFERLISAAETQHSPESVQAAAAAPAKLDAFDQSRAHYAGEGALLLRAKAFAADIAGSDARIATVLSATAAFVADDSAAAQVTLADGMMRLTDFDRGRLTDAQRHALEVGSQAVSQLSASRARLARLTDIVQRTRNASTPQLAQQLLDAATAVSAFDEAVATPEQKAALASARITVKQLAWSLLEARVRAGAREDTPETAAGIAAAYSLLKDIPRLEGVAEMIYYSQKNFNGGGFPPGGPSGEEIPPGARILRVCLDFMNTLTSVREPSQRVSAMLYNLSSYDSAVTIALRRVIDEGLFTEITPEAGHTSRSLAFHDLVAGQILDGSVETTEGQLLIRQGTVLTAALLAKLANFEMIGAIQGPITVRAEA